MGKIREARPVEDLPTGTRQPDAETSLLSPLPHHPLVSVVVPSFNYAKYLKDTVDSALAQDYDALEVIVVDGASTDGTVDLLRTYDGDPRLRWISEPDENPWEGYNKGLRMAKGDLIGTMPVTDTYVPGAVWELVDEFATDPTLAFVGGWNQEIDDQGVPTGHVTMLRKERFDYSVDDVVRWARFPRHQASLFRRDIALAIGGFDGSLQGAHGPFLFHYTLEALHRGGRIRAIPKVFANQRTHPAPRPVRTAFGAVAPIEGYIFVQRRRVCEQAAERYRSFLTPKQTRTLRRTGYYFELRYRLRARKHLLGAFPALLGYIRFGGGSHVIKKLWSIAVRPFGSS